MILRSPHGRIDVMFGPVVTTKAHLAFSGARAHSNNTAEMTAMIEALSFLGPHGPVTRDEQSCIFYDSPHVAGIYLCTIQARTHVQLALACQRSTMSAQRKLRFTMQLVNGHSGNLGNECADHAAALETEGSTSNHNVATRWIHHNFDASACLMAVTKPMRSWNDYNAFERMQRHFPKIGVSIVFTIEFVVFVVQVTCISGSFCVVLLSAFSILDYCVLEQVMNSLSSSATTVPSFDDDFAHNMWNPLLELLFLEQISGIFAS